jgi:hypothetical protein
MAGRQRQGRLLGSADRPGKRQVVQAIHTAVVFEDGLAGRQCVVRYATMPLLQPDDQFDPCQMRTKATVRASPE